MNDDAPRTILEKMTHRPQVAVPDVPLTASRAVTLAVTRAAQTRVALTLGVGSIREEMRELDALLAELNDELLIMGLGEGSETRGIIVCDAGLCGAAVEIQTTGKVAPRANEPRPITLADAALVRPFFVGLLEELLQTTPRTVLDGWTDGTGVLTRLAGPRSTGFVLPDQIYRVIRVTLSIAAGERQGEVILALPPQAAAQPVMPQPKVPQSNWAEEFPRAVLAAPACLNAVLHQFNLPLHVATQLKVGQLLPLSGCTVGTVRLVSPDGRMVARARLGQVAGQVAVRVEDSATLDLRDLPPQATAEAPLPRDAELTAAGVG